jgi:superfamily II DNA/RNA helicase
LLLNAWCQQFLVSVRVQHLAICCGYFDRPTTISGILQVYSGTQGRAMVFCETKREADELALSPEIRQEMHVLHGDIPQEKREMVLQVRR